MAPRSIIGTCVWYCDILEAIDSKNPGVSRCFARVTYRGFQVEWYPAMAMDFKGADINDLRTWFSTARLSRYASAKDPAALYAWDIRLSKAYLEDVAHIEVLLRNFISHRLALDCERRTLCRDCRWFDHPELYGLNASTISSIGKAKLRLSHEGKTASYDRIVAALTFDVWRFMLVRRLEPTVWRALRSRANGGMPFYPGTKRAEFEAHVAEIYKLRNRCSHQEHLVLEELSNETAMLDGYSASLRWVAERIDPGAARWIALNSRVDDVRAQRPD